MYSNWSWTTYMQITYVWLNAKKISSLMIKVFICVFQKHPKSYIRLEDAKRKTITLAVNKKTPNLWSSWLRFLMSPSIVSNSKIVANMTVTKDERTMVFSKINGGIFEKFKHLFLITTFWRRWLLWYQKMWALWDLMRSARHGGLIGISINIFCSSNH